MIIEYHRPTTLENALDLLARAEPVTVPLAGGSAVNRPNPEPVAVVDLQVLGLNRLEHMGNTLHMGAMVTLQALLDGRGKPESYNLPSSLIHSIEREGTYNLRQVATVAGALVAADGRSPFTTVMLALDASLILQPGEEEVDLGNLLPFRMEKLRRRLITKIIFPLNVRLAYEYVARTPADRPIVCAAVALWPSGRTRLALGGYGDAPTLAMDGTEAEGLEVAAQSAYSQAGDDWASAEYRQEMAGILAMRCFQQLS
jgi:putative selenate reductase FAD-binding subunit